MIVKCAVVPDKRPKENKKENKMEAASGQDVACNNFCWCDPGICIAEAS